MENREKRSRQTCADSQYETLGIVFSALYDCYCPSVRNSMTDKLHTVFSVLLKSFLIKGASLG